MTVTDFNLLIGQVLPEPHAGLLSGILFGTKASLDLVLYDALVKTGTLHIVALSGTNITILTRLTNLVFLRLVGRRVASLLTVLIIIGFIAFVGPSPSVIRAAIMGCVSLLGVALGKQIWGLWSFLLAAGSMLIFSPGLITDISFQLSAGATLGMILFGGNTDGAAKYNPKIDSGKLNIALDEGSSNPVKLNPFSILKYLSLRSIFHFLSKTFGEDLRTTLSAQTITIPVIFFHFHRLSLISPLPNALIGWVMAPLTAFGLFTTAMAAIWLPLGRIFGWFVWVPLEYIIRVIMVTAKIPLASVGW
jgi:competence protein ComEC